MMCRVGFTFTMGTDGLQTFGRGRPMVKDGSTQKLETFFLVISEMDGDTAAFFV